MKPNLGWPLRGGTNTKQYIKHIQGKKLLAFPEYRLFEFVDGHSTYSTSGEKWQSLISKIKGFQPPPHHAQI
jgi:hypothetical protein